MTNPQEPRRVQYLGTASAEEMRTTEHVSVARRFEAQVERTPEAPAVVSAIGTWTYRQLNSRANQVAHQLQRYGVASERRVAVLMDTSADLVATVLGVLKAGGAYVPLDPALPDERLGWLLCDADVAVVVTARHQQPRVAQMRPDLPVWDLDAPADAVEVNNPASSVGGDNAAYLTYTSGSTGTPKGVIATHRAVVGLAQDGCWSAAHRRVLLHSPQMFDAATYEMWVPLLGGGTVVVGRSGPLDTAELADDIVQYEVTAIWLTAGLFRVMSVEEPDCFGAVEEVWTGGDVVSPAAVRRLQAAHPALTVVNGYGPTETTTFATRHFVYGLPDHGVPIGQPMDDSGLWVLDPNLQPVADGAVGELYISGPGLARGYAGQPALTATRFVADPFGPPGSRMYRTGDLVRWNTAGDLEFIGRGDEQVKIRGFRVEPGEVEGALAAAPAVADVAVIVHGEEGDRRLVAYVVPTAGERLEAAALLQYARECLPKYLVPSAVVVLASLPVTTNGKLDQSALPAPDLTSEQGRGPRDEREAALCGMFADLLKVPQVSIDDDFFDLGGQSLLATRLISRIRTGLGANLRVRDLFEHPTVATLAPLLSAADSGRLDLAAGPRPDRTPLSFAQQRLWFLYKLEGPSPTYNIPVAIRLRGPLSIDALRRALASVVERHEALRTTFPDIDGEPLQAVLTAVPVLAVQAVAESDLPEAISTIVHHRFDLAHDLPVRADLLVSSPEEHTLVLVVHHIAADGWSLAPLARDLSAAYSAWLDESPPGWQPLPLQYADYALWQRRHLQRNGDGDGPLSQQLAYWRRQLSELPQLIQLPTDRPRPLALSYAGDHIRFELPTDLHRQLLALAYRCNATLFMVLHAALAVLLTRLGAGKDIAIGSPVAGRSHSALEDLVGLFVNTLVIRTDTSGDLSFRDLITQVRETSLAAYAHQDVPFELLVEDLKPLRTMAHAPLAQIALALQNTDKPDFDLVGTTGRVDQPRGAVSRLDLFLSLTEQSADNGEPAGVKGVAEYATDLFDRDTIDRLLCRWLGVLEAMVANPDQSIGVSVLLEEEQQRLADMWSGRASVAVPTTIPKLFEAQVRRSPHLVAVSDAMTQLTYAELDERANRLAARLSARGAGSEQVVGVALQRSTDLIVALLGTLKAGGAYLPIDPSYPDDRVAYILADAAPALVITTTKLAGRLPADVPTLLMDRDDGDVGRVSSPCPPLPHNLAYVVYTSGSTGRPKGVLVSHGGIADLAAELRETIAVQPGHRVLQLVSPSFDASLWDILGALLHGGTLVLAPAGGLLGEELSRFAREQQVTHLTVPPAVLAAMHPDALLPGATITVSGDVCSPGLVADWAGLHHFFNGYGPTEVTVGATMSLCRPEDGHGTVPIGRPFRGKRVYVLDERLRLVPPGVTGEVYIAGTGLARGYLNQPGQTAARFVADPLGEPGTRMYRTGDLGRWNGRGLLEFVGRADSQVKFRSFRVELGEIEAVLTEHPEVQQAAVTVREDVAGLARLVAYVVAEVGGDVPQSPQESELRTYAAMRLPEYMVPARIVGLSQLPLNSNGKLDVRALPAPDWQATSRPPRTPREEVLCRLFADVLGVPAVGLDDGFFDLGGHSLLAAKLAERIRAVLGVELPMQTLFGTSTVAGLAVRLDSEAVTASALAPLLRLRPHGHATPLFCVPPVTGLGWSYAAVLQHVSPDIPVYGLQSPGLADPADLPKSVAELVAFCADAIARVQPEGDVRLVGWSFGGMVAHALCAELGRRGRRVALLALLDARPAEPALWAATGLSTEVADETAYVQFLQAVGITVPEGMDRLSRDEFLHFAKVSHSVVASLDAAQILHMVDVMRINRRIITSYTQESADVPTLLFVASAGTRDKITATQWRQYVGDDIEVYEVPVTHFGMTSQEALRVIGPILESSLRREPREKVL